jgi:hypothetical protein
MAESMPVAFACSAGASVAMTGAEALASAFAAFAAVLSAL